jgi:uncharacterized membrane protein
MSDDDEAIGPISYLIVEFQRENMTGEGLSNLVDLVEQGLITILDLLFVTRDEDGALSAIEVTDLDGDGTLDLAVFEGASSGLIDESDMAEAASAIAPGSAAAILLFENRWARNFTQALRRGGAEVVAAGYVPLDALAETLDAIEASGD